MKETEMTKIVEEINTYNNDREKYDSTYTLGEAVVVASLLDWLDHASVTHQLKTLPVEQFESVLKGSYRTDEKMAEYVNRLYNELKKKKEG